MSGDGLAVRWPSGRSLKTAATQMLLAPGRPLADLAERLIRLQVVDRGIGLGARAFGALLPLVIVYSAVVPGANAHDFAERLIAKLKLTGAAAASMRQAVAPSGTVAQGLTVLGFVLVVASTLSFARSLQRMYEIAYGLDAMGMRATHWHLLWIALLPVYLALRPLVASLWGGWWHTGGPLLLAAVVWLLTPYLLLGKRMPARDLLPGAVFAAVGLTALSAVSAIYLPHSITSSANQYGVIGVAFAMLSWLIALGVTLVVCAAAGAVALERMRARRG